MPPRKLSIAGYEFGDVASLLALTIAGISIFWQLSAWWRGADIRVLPPLRVEFACEDDNHCHKDSNLKIVLDRLQLVNFGARGYDMLVDPGIVKVSFKDSDGKLLDSINLQALYFSERATDGIDMVPARFLLVNGGSVETQEVEYYPRRIVKEDGTVDRKNYMKFTKFKSWIQKQNGPRLVEISVKPRPVRSKSIHLGTKCHIIIDDDMISNASNSEVGTFPRDCMEP